MPWQSPAKPSPKQILLRALGENLTDAQGNRLDVELWCPLSAENISFLRFELHRYKLPDSVPEDIRELLQLAAGFIFDPIGYLDFTGECWPTPYGPLHHCGVSLIEDDNGFWLQDVRDDTGVWGPVFLVCKHPAVVAVQAPSLAEFLEQIFDIGRAGHRDMLRYVHQEAATRIWREEPWLVPARVARCSNEPLLSAFARKLPERFQVADLRRLEVGSGFGLELFGPDTIVRRCGDELLFAVGKKGLIRRQLEKLLRAVISYAEWLDRHRPRIWSRLWDKLLDLYPREFK